jgi:spoIIIJ-associated protein
LRPSVRAARPEHFAAKALRLEPEEHNLIRFEAAGFKTNRERNLRQSAALAVDEVRRTGRSHSFPPMSSHVRRMLHLALADSGLTAASEGEGAMRHLVLQPLSHP